MKLTEARRESGAILLENGLNGYGVEDRSDPQSIVFHVGVNETELYSINDEGGIHGFRWSEVCDRLAFLEGEGNHVKFVVLNNSSVSKQKSTSPVSPGEQSIQVFQG
jgi:hypothetical protein